MLVMIIGCIGLVLNAASALVVGHRAFFCFPALPLLPLTDCTVEHPGHSHGHGADSHENDHDHDHGIELDSASNAGLIPPSAANEARAVVSGCRSRIALMLTAVALARRPLPYTRTCCHPSTGWVKYRVGRGFDSCFGGCCE